MPVSIPDLKRAGVSSGAYKPLFTAPGNKKLPLVKKLEVTLTDRIKDVRTRNLENYRTYWAIDLAHEVPFMQTTPTLVQNLLSRHLSAEQISKQLGAWGLSEEELFLKVEVQGVGTKLVLNPPVFYQIFLPFVKAYHTIRTASIYAERDTSPLFKFTPLQQTDRNRVACDIWTDIVETIATWYGYPAYMKQAIQQMLKYGVMMAFPMEEWHCERQIISGSAVVQKEGLRYIMPHPTRMGWDLNHPAPTINTDTGVEWGLHWNVLRYGDILENRKYWNRKAITHGSTNWFDPVVAQNYFEEVYPCQLRFPPTSTFGAKREDKAAFYSSANVDHAVFLTTVFWKLIPKNWGLSEYEYPVWHRFDLANDDTVIWAAPCAYNPMWFMGYDFDSQAGQHSSLSLEAIPWQDHIGNLLSQMILTAKQNLVNIIYYDKNLVDKTRIDEIKNLGEGRYRSFHFIDYDSMSLARGAGLDARNAFHQVQFQPKSIVELQSMVSTALTLAERMLQFTAQETGAAASHYQSKGEVDITAGNASTRRNLTAAGVDEGNDAWKTQIVTGAKAYLNNDVVAQVSSDIKNYEQHVADLGFEIKGTGDRKVLVAGKKSGLPLETFARSNMGPTQPNDPQTAQAITSALSVAFQNEQVFAKIGAKRIVKLLEQAVKLAGGPRDFDISSEANDEEGDIPALIQKLQPVFESLQASIMQTVQEKVVQPIAQESAEEQQRLNNLETITKQLQQIWQAAGVEAEKLKIEQAQAQQKMQIEQMRFQADETRKAEAHALDLQTKATKAGLDATATVEKVQSDVAIAEQRAAVERQTKLEKHESDLRIDRQAAETDKEVALKVGEAKAKAAKAAPANKPADKSKP